MLAAKSIPVLALLVLAASHAHASNPSPDPRASLANVLNGGLGPRPGNGQPQQPPQGGPGVPGARGLPPVPPPKPDHMRPAPQGQAHPFSIPPPPPVRKPAGSPKVVSLRTTQKVDLVQPQNSNVQSRQTFDVLPPPKPDSPSVSRVPNRSPNDSPRSGRSGSSSKDIAVEQPAIKPYRPPVPPRKKTAGQPSGGDNIIDLSAKNDNRARSDSDPLDNRAPVEFQTSSLPGSQSAKSSHSTAFAPATQRCIEALQSQIESLWELFAVTRNRITRSVGQDSNAAEERVTIVDQRPSADPVLARLGTGLAKIKERVTRAEVKQEGQEDMGWPETAVKDKKEILEIYVKATLTRTNARHLIDGLNNLVEALKRCPVVNINHMYGERVILGGGPVVVGWGRVFVPTLWELRGDGDRRLSGNVFLSSKLYVALKKLYEHLTRVLTLGANFRDPSAELILFLEEWENTAPSTLNVPSKLKKADQ